MPISQFVSLIKLPGGAEDGMDRVPGACRIAVSDSSIFNLHFSLQCGRRELAEVHNGEATRKYVFYSPLRSFYWLNVCVAMAHRVYVTGTYEK